MSKQQNICPQCGTELVESKEILTLDGSFTLDGSCNLDNKVCPHCHPELVKDDNN